MNKLSTALGLALLGTSAQAVQLGWNEPAEEADCDCACDQEPDDPCCNSGPNNVNIAIAFSVDVEDPPAPVAAVAPTEPATTPTADATPLVVVSAGTIALNESTSVGSDPTAAPGSPAQTWGEISSAALDEDNGGPAAWRLTEAYTGRSPRDRAVIDALIAAAGQTGVIPAGTSVNIMYTSEGITAESTAAAAG